LFSSLIGRLIERARTTLIPATATSPTSITAPIMLTAESLARSASARLAFTSIRI
jgi:hypothetical protein